MKSPLEMFIERVVQDGLEAFGRFYGFYRGICTRNDDPQGRGRIQARCPMIGHGDAPNVWIDPIFESAGASHGTFFPPVVGDCVRVCFECGNPQIPDGYVGGWYGTADVPAEVAYSDGTPERRGFVSRAGHSLVFCDEPGKESIQLIWHKPDSSDESLTDLTVTADRTRGKFAFMSFNDDGSIQFVNPNGSNINIDATNKAVVIMDESGNTVTLDADGSRIIDNKGNVVSLSGGDITILAGTNVHVVGQTVNVKAGTVALGDQATYSAVVGEICKEYLGNHTHTSPMGPTGMPVLPPPPSILSVNVKLRG